MRVPDDLRCPEKKKILQEQPGPLNGNSSTTNPPARISAVWVNEAPGYRCKTSANIRAPSQQGGEHPDWATA